MSLCEVIDMQRRTLEKLESLSKSISSLSRSVSGVEEKLDYVKEILEAVRPELAEPRAVDLKPHYYVFYLDELIRWLEHAGVVSPALVELSITLEAGSKGYVDLWLPRDTACIGRTYELHFPTSKGLRYGWMVDSTLEFTVPMHYFIPNKGYVEESVFGRYWIKWYFLRFHYEALEPGQVIIRAWAKLIKHSDLDRLLTLMDPLAEVLQIKLPTSRAVPLPTASEVVKECKACGAKMLRSDDKIVRVGQWGRNYTDHECEVFS